MYYFEAVLLLLYPIFGDILPKSISEGALIFGFLVALLALFQNNSFNLRKLRFGLAWIVLGVIAICGFAATAQEFEFPVLALLLSVVMLVCAAPSTKWVKPFYNVLLCMLCVHMLATICFYYFPGLYDAVIKPVFFRDNVNATGYQSALTRHYSNNGIFLAFGSVLAFGYMLNGKGLKRVPLSILTILFFYALILTTKRNPLICACIAVAFIYFSSGIKNKGIKFCLMSVLVLIGLSILYGTSEGVSASIDRLLDTFMAEDATEATSGRTFLWEQAFEDWERSPLIGNGWSSYIYVWPSGLTSIYAHNELLQLLAETGIVGLVTFLIASVWALVGTFMLTRLLKTSPCADGFLATSVLCALGIQVFTLSYSCTGGVLLQMPLVFMPYFLSVATAISVLNSSDLTALKKTRKEVPYSANVIGSSWKARQWQ